ncbi:hypothetical protein ACFLS4_00605 [Bacteroidota bacterium]
MILYNFNESIGIVETTFKGEVSINDIIKYIISLRENRSTPKKLKIFTNASKGEITKKFVPRDLVNLIEENKTSLAQRDFIYDAFVVSGSLETALGMLYKELIEMDNYKFKIFSTKEAALNWLEKF